MSKHTLAAPVLAAILIVTNAGVASAAEFTLEGELEVITGAFAILLGPGTPVAGPVVFDDGAVAGGLAGPGDLLRVDVNVGTFCFSSVPEDPNPPPGQVIPIAPLNCPLGGTYVPIRSFDTATITFADGFPSGGTFSVTSFSPTFGSEIPIFFDLDAGTVFADGTAGGLGTASGFIAFVRPPTLSAAPNPATFDPTPINTSRFLDVVVSNIGDSDLRVTTVGAVDSLAPPYAITADNCSDVVLIPDGTCTLQVEFAPGAPGSPADSFDIAAEDTAMMDPVDVASLTVDVTGTVLVPDIAVSPAPLAFATTTVGDNRIRTVTVTNDGGATLNLGQVTMPADTQFTVGDDLCSNMSVVDGMNCTFAVTFAPLAEGMFMTSLDIPSDDPDTPVSTLDISGTGAIAMIAEISVDPASLAFDELLVGDSATMDIVITSSGNADLEIAAFTFSGADAADFSQSNDCPAMLASAATCTATVTFAPLTGGDPKDATMTIESNAGAEPMLVVTLAGSAFDGPRIAVDPVELGFGSPAAPVDIGASATATTTVSNTGNADLSITAIDFSGGDGEFSVDSEDCTATAVPPTGSCTITALFSPLTEPDKTGTMSISSNDASNSPVDVGLTGFVFRGSRIGVASLEVDVTGENPVEVGQSTDSSIAIESTGTDELFIESVTLGGTNASDFAITENCTAGPIAAGSSCTIGVGFNPQSAGNKTATVTIRSNSFSAARGAGTETIIMLSATAVDPPPPPLSVPPVFATSEVGGTGSAGLWLLGVGLALLAMRRRQDLVRQMKGIEMRHVAPCLAIAAALAVPTPASAVSFESESGNITGSWDTTISFGAAYRLQAAADNLVGTVNGGTKYSVNGDDGTLNFHRGLYSNALKVTSELEVNYLPGNVALFMRGFYFFDHELENDTRDRTPLSEAALDLAGSDGDLLDAFVSWQFDLGDRPAELRVGEQVVNWGESTFIQGGMNVINHINVSALRVPGAELREALLPQDLAVFSIGLTPNLDVEIVYQYDWDDTEPDPVGTYFSTNDFAVDGGTAVRLGFGDTPDTPPPPFFTPDHAFNAIPRGVDGAPSDDGQWGWAARYFAEDFNNGTEFGIYYYNYHSRLPLISAQTGSFEGLGLAGAIGLADENIANAAIDYLAMNPGDTGGAIAAGVTAGPSVPDYVSQGIAATAITSGLPTALAIASAYSTDAFANTPSTGTDPFNSPAGQTAQYFTDFPEDIQLYGFSWNTTLGQTAWQGEIAHHQNRPLQIDDLEILFAGLSSLRSAFAQFGQLGSFSFVGGQANPDTPPLTRINGYYRRDYTQANMAFTRLFGPLLGADQGVLLFEFAYHHVHGFPDKDVLRFDGPGTVVSGSEILGPAAHPGKPVLDPKHFPDEDSWGYRLAGRLDYNNVIGSFNMSPRFAWQQDVSGITPGPAGAFIEGRKALTIGNRFTYQNKWEFDMSYSLFFGGGFQNEIHDRDFVAASVKYTF